MVNKWLIRIINTMCIVFLVIAIALIIAWSVGILDMFAGFYESYQDYQDYALFEEEAPALHMAMYYANKVWLLALLDIGLYVAYVFRSTSIKIKLAFALFLLVQIMLMLYVMYADIFQCACVVA